MKTIKKKKTQLKYVVQKGCIIRVDDHLAVKS